MHFLEIICADIVFKFLGIHIHVSTEGRGVMTFKGESKGAKRGHAPPPKRPKKAQSRHQDRKSL